MNFEERLNRILNKIMFESEFDYLNDWERFRQEREKLRRQAAEDQRKAADDEAGRKLQHDITRAGGLGKWLTNDPNWRPSSHLVLIEDIETGEGLLLPSLRKKGKELYLFIPWALVEITNPTPHIEGEIGKTYPFCQFEEDKWPSQTDFDWQHARPRSPSGVPAPHDVDPEYYFLHDVTWNKRYQLNEKAAIRLFESDKNHYHMLRGDDKAIVDTLVENKAEDWFRDNQEIEKYEDYYGDE